MQLRPYQIQTKESIYASWAAGARNVLATLPTGAGKTVVFSDIIREHTGAVCAIAHRQELVGQISLALARDGVRHRIVGPRSVVKLCVQIHVNEVGRAYYSPDAKVAVAGVDTIIRRKDSLRRWADSVSLWVQDEAHHVLKTNKWGSAAEMFPNARGLGVTATPQRADGAGLGRAHDGLFDDLIIGPSMRELVDLGFLTDYRIFGPPSNLNLEDVKVSGATGDYVRAGLKHAVRRSTIVGDVVEHYKRIAEGKLGVTFATDVETATDIAGQFNANGVPAAVITAKTPDAERIETVRRFARRDLLQLVNVDIFGEGFDLPAIEVVSMARPTQSLNLYIQQFGRGLRPLEGKQKAIIIDHVGNVRRHGLPDVTRRWSLEPRASDRKAAASGAVPVRTCLGCFSVYERIMVACPYCGQKPVPAQRSKPEFVDGDLTELDPEALEAMRAEVERVDMPVEDYRAHLISRFVPRLGQLHHCKRHAARQEAQQQLRAGIAQWAGYLRAAGRTNPEIYRRFYFTFGTDILSAQVLGVTEAAQLTDTINQEIRERHEHPRHLP